MSLGKRFLAWRFINKWKHFVLINHIFIYKFTAKVGLTFAISIVKWFFWNFCLEKIFFTFLCWMWITDISQQFCENFGKIEQAELVENLPSSYLPYRFLHNSHSFLLWEKVKIFNFLKTNDYNKSFCAGVVTTNGFALNNDKSLQIHFFCVKPQAKHDFLKDVESTVESVWSLPPVLS